MQVGASATQENVSFEKSNECKGSPHSLELSHCSSIHPLLGETYTRTYCVIAF